MKKTLNEKEVKEILKRELPGMMKKDEEITTFILHLSNQYYAGKVETESRFERIMLEIQKDREEQNKKWEEQNKKWEENQKIIRGMFEELKILNKKHDHSIGALGARWGLQSESSFRNALAAILEKSFNVKVLHINEFDDKGEVFGRPDQVELDVIIKNGHLIICEIKSSTSRADVYIFNKKISFYERLHACKADRRIIISPMIEEKAKEYSAHLGIEYYSYTEDIKEDIKEDLKRDV